MGTYEYLALSGGLCLTRVVALFTPRIDYTVHQRMDCTTGEFVHAPHSTTQTTVHHVGPFCWILERQQ